MHESEHIHTEHPLKLNFRDYLSRLPDDELRIRLGDERYGLFKEGLLDASEYMPPKQGERFTIDMLKRADIDSFTMQK